MADFFLTMRARVGSLERLLVHAIRTWVELGELFDAYADFERDGFRCTAPGCTARNNLHSHPIGFRSHRGPDEPGKASPGSGVLGRRLPPAPGC